MKKQFLLILLLLVPLAFALVFPKETIYFDRISPNYKQVGVVYDPEILITSIGIIMNTNATRARITVQAMPDCPENAPYQIDVLQCFFITTFNIEEDNITSTEISFKVPREWVVANNYDKNEIELRRYSYSWNSGGVLSTWKELQTNLTEENENFYRYTAQGDGFDYFSIAGTLKAQPIVEVQELAPAVEEERPEEIIVPIVETKEVVIETPAPKPTLSSYEWVSIAVIALLSLILTLMVPRHQPTLQQQSHFEKLIKYVQSAKDKSEDEIMKKLQDAGWEDWQITLALNEVRRKN